jgi:membrane-bound inhibitor of C-type lysozyme
MGNPDGIVHSSIMEGPEMKAAMLIVATAALPACSTIAGDGSDRRVVYACNYGPNLTVVYSRSTARIESEDGTVTLEQRPAASGFWYETATHSLRGSGNELSYKDRQMAPRQCRAM